ncbi:MAG TPA: hypothetical protein VGS12_00585 [Caulobacteraceae bacterium]|nr:hypothetical protein [Caulobacteraceae bacterium]
MWALALAGVLAWLGATAAASATTGEHTPTGQRLTPAAAPGAIFQPLRPGLAQAPGLEATSAAAVALSPDGRTLLILTSGFNRVFGPDGELARALSDEYVFVFDVTGPAPVQQQAFRIGNTFLGLAWSPDGEAFFVSGGKDDEVREFRRGGDGFAPARTFRLGHKAGVGLAVEPEAAGVAVSPDGARLLVANFQNDSVSLVDLKSGMVTAEQDLRPGVIDKTHSGEPGGTFPRAVIWASPRRAFVVSERDRELITLTVGEQAITAGARLRLPGQPQAMALDRAGARLFVAMDNTDGVAVVDADDGRLLELIPTAAPPALLARLAGLGGAGSNALALSQGGRRLFVSNGAENAVAVVELSAAARGGKEGPPASRVVGLIPTGWYPTGVAAGAGRLFVVNGKSNTGPNPGGCRQTLAIRGPQERACAGANQYVWQLEKAGFLTLPPPRGAALARLTSIVAANDGLGRPALSPHDEAVMAFLRRRIRHVIYIVKENRTYDQILGDLAVGNGDPRLALFGAALTPNQHALARRFVDLDAFFDAGESSNTGWVWSTAARTNDFTEREAPVNYAERGLQYDQEGTNRNINVGWATTAERLKADPLNPDDPNVLAGERDVAAPDGPHDQIGRGYLWDDALRAGLWVRNYGFLGDLVLEDRRAGKYRIPLLRQPWKSRTPVFRPAKKALMAISDPYFRGFDQAFPDYWRFVEWNREFQQFAARGRAPALTLLRLNHDHTGDFAEAIDKVNTVEAEVADNDYAVGRVIEAVAASPFAKDTLIFVIEDDAQDGPDHVDAHRSVAFVAGPYVKHAAVVSRRYDTVNMIRTMEMVLGLPPLGIEDALAAPMTDVFDTAHPDWSFRAVVPDVLTTTDLPVPRRPASMARAAACPPRSSAYWAKAMAGQDFSSEDRLDTPRYNLALWRGLMGAAAPPAARDGRDLSRGRAAIDLAAARRAECQASQGQGPS